MTDQSWVSGGAAEPDPDARQFTVAAPDGRTLGVAEYGPGHGTPVFMLHGTPGCRYGGPPPEHPDLYDRLGLRSVSYDRAGYGLSTRRPGRIVADVADDVAAIADHLDLGRFAVAGGSGGGPHALAVAALLGDRVDRVACVVGVAPLGGPGLPEEQWLAGMTQGNVNEFQWALAGEATLREQLEPEAAEELLRLETDPGNPFGDDYVLSEADRQILADPRRQVRLRREIQEAYRSGVDGWIDDNLCFVRPWGFDLAGLRTPAMVWFGLSDTLVPSAHGEWLAAHVPDAWVVRMPGGHLDLAHRVADVATWLVGGPTPADATKG